MNKYSNDSTGRIGKVVVALIIGVTIAIMVALWFIFDTRSFVENQDILFVAAEAATFFIGYEVLMAFVRWSDKKGIL